MRPREETEHGFKQKHDCQASFETNSAGQSQMGTTVRQDACGQSRGDVTPSHKTPAWVSRDFKGTVHLAILSWYCRTHSRGLKSRQMVYNIHPLQILGPALFADVSPGFHIHEFASLLSHRHTDHKPIASVLFHWPQNTNPSSTALVCRQLAVNNRSCPVYSPSHSHGGPHIRS